MPWIKDEYKVFYKDVHVGMYYVYDNGTVMFYTYENIEPFLEELRKLGLNNKNSYRKPFPFFNRLLKETNRVPTTRKRCYQLEGVILERIPDDVDKYMVFRLSADPGEPGYSEKRYSKPHREFGKEIEGMNEWVSWYCFNKKDDGMYEAELDEAWWWGGGHNDGGTIRTEVPEEWLSLPYDEFLENVVRLSAAAYYGFTAEELKEKEGLKEFFGFEGEQYNAC